MSCNVWRGIIVCFSLLRPVNSLKWKADLNRRHSSTILDMNSIITGGNTAIPALRHINDRCDVILASGSPRRKELLALMGIQNFRVVKSDFAEDLDHKKFPLASSYCLETAVAKAADVVSNIEKSGNQKCGTLLIGSDTIVEIDGRILEKPRDTEDAYSMISLLSGNVHVVHTAVTIFGNGKPNETDKLATAQMIPLSSFVESTSVKFMQLDEADKIAYIESREGFDKAGGYGIQGLGGQMVEKIDGCYFNVMGLPLSRLSKEIAILYKSGRI